MSVTARPRATPATSTPRLRGSGSPPRAELSALIKYLLDTNVVSEPLRARPNPHLMERLARTEGQCAISSVTWHELSFGALRLPEGKRRARIIAYLSEVLRPSLPIIPYEALAAARHAAIRSARAAQGRPLPFADGQIAAIALAHNLKLVTANTKDFTQIEELTLEDWSRASQ